jgi:hypothetical protein
MAKNSRPKTRRPKMAGATRADVLYRSDGKCCLCESRGHHIHHIDGNPANQDIGNLVLLCIEHHSEVTARGPLIVKQTPDSLRKFREHRYRSAAHRRSIEDGTAHSGEGASVSFELILDAVQVAELRHAKHLTDWASPSSQRDLARSMLRFRDESGEHVRLEVLSVADLLATELMSPPPFDVLEAVADAVGNVAIRGVSANVRMMDYAAYIGSCILDRSVSTRDLALLDVGGRLLWLLLRHAALMALTKPMRAIQSVFEDVRKTAAKAEFTEACRWLTFLEGDALALPGSSFPAIPWDLEKLIGTARSKRQLELAAQSAKGIKS